MLNNIIGQSSVALISQSYGSGDTDETKRVIEQTFVFKGLLAVVASLIMAVSLRPLLSLFTKDALVLQAAMSYGIVRIIGLLSTAFADNLRGLGIPANRLHGDGDHGCGV